MATKNRREYLLALADLIGKARELADTFPNDEGWGGGFDLETTLPDGTHLFGYGNTSDLLSDLEDAVREGATA